MFWIFIFLSCILSINGQLARDEEKHPAPEPYSFAYSAANEDGSSSSREETGDASGRITGFYTLVGADGQQRRVEYVADENGFRANVVTNEIGTESQNPADVQLVSSAPTAAQLVSAWTPSRHPPRPDNIQTVRPVVRPVPIGPAVAPVSRPPVAGPGIVSPGIAGPVGPVIRRRPVKPTVSVAQAPVQSHGPIQIFPADGGFSGVQGVRLQPPISVVADPSQGSQVSASGGAGIGGIRIGGAPAQSHGGIVSSQALTPLNVGNGLIDLGSGYGLIPLRGSGGGIQQLSGLGSGWSGTGGVILIPSSRGGHRFTTNGQQQPIVQQLLQTSASDNRPTIQSIDPNVNQGFGSKI